MKIGITESWDDGNIRWLFDDEETNFDCCNTLFSNQIHAYYIKSDSLSVPINIFKGFILKINDVKDIEKIEIGPFLKSFTLKRKNEKALTILEDILKSKQNIYAYAYSKWMHQKTLFVHFNSNEQIMGIDF